MNNNIIKLLSSVGAVTQQVKSNIVDKGQDLIENQILKGHYVTREEFENLKQLVINLQEELSKPKK